MEFEVFIKEFRDKRLLIEAGSLGDAKGEALRLYDAGEIDMDDGCGEHKAEVWAWVGDDPEFAMRQIADNLYGMSIHPRDEFEKLMGECEAEALWHGLLIAFSDLDSCEGEPRAGINRLIRFAGAAHGEVEIECGNTAYFGFRQKNSGETTVSRIGEHCDYIGGCPMTKGRNGPVITCKLDAQTWTWSITTNEECEHFELKGINDMPHCRGLVMAMPKPWELNI